MAANGRRPPCVLWTFFPQQLFQAVAPAAVLLRDEQEIQESPVETASQTFMLVARAAAVHDFSNQHSID